jgi:hypothetical protein
MQSVIVVEFLLAAVDDFPWRSVAVGIAAHAAYASLMGPTFPEVHAGTKLWLAIGSDRLLSSLCFAPSMIGSVCVCWWLQRCVWQTTSIGTTTLLVRVLSMDGSGGFWKSVCGDLGFAPHSSPSRSLLSAAQITGRTVRPKCSAFA